MREREFKEWLEAKKIKTVSYRMSLVRKVERALNALGSQAADLDEAHRQDGLKAVAAALSELARKTPPGEPVPILLPRGSKNPQPRFNNLLASLRNYRQFADGEPPNATPEDDIDDEEEEDTELTREAVEAAMDECDRLGEDAFLTTYGFGRPRDFWVRRGDASYPAKAIAGVAYKYLPNGAPRSSQDIGGGYSRADTACTILEALGYEIVDRSVKGSPAATKLSESTTPAPTNLILFGPPGTGKTYASAAEAVRLCLGDVSEDRAELMKEYARLASAGQIEFVTFHQSYSYEEFVEGLRPRQNRVEDDIVGDVAGFELRPEAGAFKRIALRARSSAGRAREAFEIGDRRIFKMSIGEAANPEDNYLFDEALEAGYVLLGWGDKVDWSHERFADREAMIEAWKPFHEDERPLTAKSGPIKYPFILRNRVREGDIIVVSKGNSLFRAIGVVTGPYEYAPRQEDDKANRRAVKWLWSDTSGIPVEEIYTRAFSMSSLYELDRAELKIPALERYVASHQNSASAANDQFVLIIDEINRANISKVFGELITLIEPDKRLGATNELKATLPYSREQFGVPPNLHIIGTMNTADRSIALLDTALRRRFDFKELMPDPDALEEAVDGVPLRRLLATLNARIEFLFDREHQIGHALFMGCRSRENVDRVMRLKVIPLLQEYFFEDWEKIALVLGDAGAAPGEGAFVVREQLSPPPAMETDDGVESRWRWRVRMPFKPNAYDNFQ